MTASAWTVLLLLALSPQALEGKGKRVKRSFQSSDQVRDFHLYVPEQLGKPEEGVPLVLTLHGSGRRGDRLVEKWKKLADKERFIVAGLDSLKPIGWLIPQDGPQPLYDLVELLTEELPIDPRRVYLFGHSAGAMHGLLMGLFEPGYFAAVVCNAGGLPQGEGQVPIVPEGRKVPVMLIVGTDDPWLLAVRHTQEVLQSLGFTVELRELLNEGHGYRLTRHINRLAWDFLRTHRLAHPPYYTEHSFQQQ